MPDHYALEDSVMSERFSQIVQEYGIKLIIETGIDKGLSTIALSKMVPLVLGIDNNPQAIAIAEENRRKAGVNNLVLINGNSPTVLSTLKVLFPKETIYFLDAHWQQYWPLLDEIRSIKRGEGIIVLHDYKVPDRPELGYDSYGGHDLCYEYVKEALTEWSPSHRVECNSAALCPTPRGVAYIFPQ